MFLLRIIILLMGIFPYMKLCIMHMLRNRRVVLKLDFEKAYDKVNWDFSLACHGVRGFNDKWCLWVKQILNNGTVSIKINDQLGPYFQSAKGVRQGEPMSPFLFNMAVECLTKMSLQAKKMTCLLVWHRI